MKNLQKFWAFAAVIGLLLNTACGDDTPDPTTEPVAGEDIAGTWNVAEANDVSGPAADQFSSFSIVINATTSQVSYTTSGNGDPLVFPDAGTFAVEDSDNFESGADVMRGPDDVDVRMTLTEDGNVLTMDFNINITTEASINSREASINGDYRFVLQRQETTPIATIR